MYKLERVHIRKYRSEGNFVCLSMALKKNTANLTLV